LRVSFGPKDLGKTPRGGSLYPKKAKPLVYRRAGHGQGLIGRATAAKGQAGGWRRGRGGYYGHPIRLLVCSTNYSGAFRPGDRPSTKANNSADAASCCNDDSSSTGRTLLKGLRGQQ